MAHSTNTVALILVLSALLGARHATDPDHLSAMLTLRLTRTRKSPHHLGLSWGFGHAVTMLLVGAPLIFLVAELPEQFQQGLEFAVGMMIVILATRVILCGVAMNVHEHAHSHHTTGTHTHVHAHPDDSHEHGIRGKSGAFMMGMLHGAGGSAGVVALILSRMQDHTTAYAALVVIAVFSALSMAAFSWLLYRGLDRVSPIVGRRTLAIAGGLLTLAFGLWYCAASLEAVPYPF